jgi:hypothetical protein
MHTWRLADAETIKRIEAGDIVWLDAQWPRSINTLRVATHAAIVAYQKSGKMIDAALTYGRFGIPIFPLDPVSKAPIPAANKDAHGNKIPGTGSFYKATCDPVIIDGWWRRTPRALIGMPMGRASGVWCVDIDTPEDHEDGVAGWDEVVAQHEPIITREHRSATGGPHLIFPWDPDIPIGCSKGDLPAGISVKGQGGYIVVPPSMRKQRTYTVYSDVDAIEAPGWLIERIKPNRLHEPWNGPEQPPAEYEDVAEAMRCIPNEQQDWDYWAIWGLRIYAATNGQGFAIFDEWSAKLDYAYDQDATRERWKEISRSKPNRTGASKIFKIARQHGWKRKPRQSTSEPKDEPVAPDVASAMMREAVREFLYGSVWDPDHLECNYFRDYACESFGPHIRAARIDVAGGKTTITIAELAEWMRRTGKSPVIYAVPHHGLSPEIIALFAEQGVHAAIFRGRGQDDPDNPGQEMCLNPKAVKVALACHADVYHSCCKGKKGECVFFKRPCGYIGQFPEKGEEPDVWIVAADMLFQSQDVLGEPVAVIIDEAFWQKGIRGIEDKKGEFKWSVPVPSLLHPAEGDGERNYYRGLLGEALQKQVMLGGLRSEHLVELNVVDCNKAISLEWQSLPKVELKPGMGSGELKRLEDNHALIDAIQHGRRVIRIWEAVREIVQLIEPPKVCGEARERAACRRVARHCRYQQTVPGSDVDARRHLAELGNSQLLFPTAGSVRPDIPESRRNAGRRAHCHVAAHTHPPSARCADDVDET